LSGLILKHLFGAYPALLLLVILAGHQSCSARKNSNVDCAPSDLVATSIILATLFD